MTLAMDFYKKFWADPDLPDRTPAEAFEEFCMARGISPRIDRDNGPGNADPSWDVHFPDGSYCHIGNPHEACFDGFVIAHSYPEDMDWAKTRRQIEDRLRKDNNFLSAVIELWIEEFGGSASRRGSPKSRC